MGKFVFRFYSQINMLLRHVHVHSSIVTSHHHRNGRKNPLAIRFSSNLFRGMAADDFSRAAPTECQNVSCGQQSTTRLSSSSLSWGVCVAAERCLCVCINEKRIYLRSPNIDRSFENGFSSGSATSLVYSNS